MSAPPRRILVVAGHDPTGGAGVDADREAVRSAGAHFGMELEAQAVVTTWTEQDARRVHAVRPRSAEAWLEDALEAVRLERTRGGFGALKTGLLASAAHVRAASELVRHLRAQEPGVPVVVDPVLAASSGTVFLDVEGRAALLASLLPLGVHLTPNLPEAASLLDEEPAALVPLESRIEAARRLLARGAAAIHLKGGHGTEDPVHDLVLARGAEPFWATHPRRPGGLHGSGCRFASALAAALSLGATPAEAATLAGRSVAALFS